MFDGSIHQLPDVDPQETAEWLESLDAVIDAKGKALKLPTRTEWPVSTRWTMR